MIFENVLTLQLMLEMHVAYFLRKFKLLLYVFLYHIPYTMSVDVTIRAPVFMVDHQNWQISIELPSTVTDPTDGFGSVVPLIFFVESGVQDIRPCPDVTDMCCLALTMKERAWKGDISILDKLTKTCETSDTNHFYWSDLTEFANREKQTDFLLTLTRDDLTEGGQKRAVYNSKERVYEVSVLVLLVRPWDDTTGQSQLINVQTVSSTVRIDLQRKLDIPGISAVDLDIDCHNLKPAKSFFIPRRFASNQTSLQCEWVCEAEYVRCPLYATDDEASCVLKPAATSRVFFTRVGILSSYGGSFQKKIDLFNQKIQLQEMTKQIGSLFEADGMVLRECLLYLTTENLLRDARVAYNTVDSHTLLDRTTALQLTETFAIVGDMSPVRISPDTQIAYSVTNDDRFIQGFLEYNILYFMETETEILAESGKLSAQAENIRRVLNNFFMYGAGNATVIYISNVEVLDRGFQNYEYISAWNFTLIILWAAVVVSLLIWNLFCPSGVTPCVASSNDSCTPTKGCCINPQHSPHGLRIILVSSSFLFLIFVGLLFTYIWVLLPSFDMASNRRAFMALAFFGATLLPAIAIYVCFCTCLTVCLTRQK